MNEREASPAFENPEALIADCAARGGVLYGQLPDEKDRRVLLASHELGRNGAPIVLLYMARSLRRLGWQPVLISPAAGPLLDTLMQESFPVLLCPSLTENDIVPRAAGLFRFVVLNTLVFSPIAAVLNGSGASVLWWLHEAEEIYHSDFAQRMPLYLFSNITVYADSPRSREHLLRYRPDYCAGVLAFGIPDAAGQDVKPYPLSEKAKGKRVFALVGGANGAGALCARLAEAGLGHVTVHVGERLSYPEEKVTSGSASELAEKQFDSLSAVLIENPSPDAVLTPGLPDSVFQREEKVPMTKSEVRAVSLSKLRLTENAVCWDVGAGTGSVALEMAMIARKGHVYGIERKDDALQLMTANASRLGVENLTPVPGKAPDACRELPAPTHAFIGGSGGNLREIISLLLEKNPRVRIVVTAVTLETVGETTALIKEFPFTETEVVSLSVARDRKAGPYRLMTGLNPVFIFTMQAGGGEA